MSDEVPKNDAEDVLRVIRGDGEGAPRQRTPAPGTFLLTSVHRVGEATQDTDDAADDAPQGDRTRPDREDGPSDEARRSGPPSGRDMPGRRLRSVTSDPDGRRPDRLVKGPKPWEGPAAPTRATLGAGPDGRSAEGAAHGRGGTRAPDTVPGLEDPTGADEAAPGPLSTDPRRAKAADEERVQQDLVRRMVDEVLEERLSGELGLRITRNVRALVRREVARALKEQAED